MRSYIAAALTGAGILGASLTFAPTAAAQDVGDGLLACNSGEICFASSVNTTSNQRHFWWDADHEGLRFSNGEKLQDNAEQIRNRDTSCDVRVIDDGGARPDEVFVAPNDNRWYVIAAPVRNQNDRHERFGCG